METNREKRAASIVVIDDEPNMCQGLKKLLGIEGYSVEAFTNPREALEHIRRAHPDIVLLDLMMPDMGGMEVLREIRGLDRSVAVIMVTAHGTIDNAIEAVKEGAYHYITKPFNTNELLLTIHKSLSHRRLVAENVRLSEQLSQADAERILVGESEAIRQVRDMIERVAPTESAVLITGESGTGKELAARAVHRRSGRNRRHFVPINCASIPENLLESELFGHEKGAFTGADKLKIGLFELSHQGTLFLDEIGELPVGLQAKLLRALETHEIQRVGGLRSIPVDIRLIAATNRNLQQHVDSGRFRRDLYFRLNVVEIRMPPLRKMKEDIPDLAEHIVRRLAVQFEKPRLSIDETALELLQAYWWPGNVRELENVLERTVVLLDGNRIDAHNLPADLGETAAVGDTTPPPMISRNQGSLESFRDARDRFERAYFERLLGASEGNVAEAARRSGISRRHFYDKIEKLGLEPQQFARGAPRDRSREENPNEADASHA